MTTINTIEQKILEMDGGQFQKLCDAYLSISGYGKPNAFGVVSGNNKVKKGTPDTFFERKNGKLVFAEYTTQKKSIFTKLDGDIDKCLDEKKIKISIDKLDEIVICYTSQLSPSEVISLKAKCEKKKVKLSLIGLSTLANDFLNYPILLRNFLNINIDTGQIIPLEMFPSAYGKSKFATTLETKFHFREKELEDISNALESFDLVIVSGKSGIGKSRFALEGCRNFVIQHPEYKAYSIVSQSQNLYEDLTERLSQSGNYLILVDDANRVISFSYFMHKLRDRKDNQKIKIVVTVRDYALDKIKNEVFDYPHHSIEIERLSNEQIKKIAKTEFGILNHYYLERIEELSKGNARIAVMVSKIAVEKNSLDSINDISSLYNQYFSSIEEDLGNFRETDVLKTAGIIAFLRAVDRSNEEMMLGIEKSFNISQDVFWDCAFRLHELEIVDMYEDEVVRISDQVLSTYLFYLVFFKEKVLDFYSVLENYFPMFRSKIIDSLNPMISAFDEKSIFEIILPKVKKIWEHLLTNNDEEKILALAQTFGYLQPEETLLLAKKRLEQNQFADIDLSQLEQIDSNKLNNISISAELQLLGNFRYPPPGAPELQKIALETLINYLNIRPADTLQVLHILIDDYGFNRHSNQVGFLTQEMIIDLLWGKVANGDNELYSKLFIATAKEYIKVYFHVSESRSNRTVTFYDFVLLPEPVLLRLRTKIFNYLINLYKKYPQDILSILNNYIKEYHHAAVDDIFLSDSLCILPFIQNNLNPENYAHNIFVNEYLDFLENRNVVFDKTSSEKFRNNIFMVYQLLSENRRDFLQYEYKEYENIRKNHFASYFSDFSYDDITQFIDICVGIVTVTSQNHDRYEVINSFGLGIIVLAETRQDLFEETIAYYLQQGDKLDLHPIPIIRIFMTTYGKESTFEFLNKFDYPTKKRWLFGYYQMLSKDKIELDDVSSLYKLFQDAEYSQLPNHFDFLLEYIPFDNHFVAKVVQLILDKGDSQYSAWVLSSITNPYSEIHKHILKIFEQDIEVLKRVYLTVKEGKNHDDHNSKTLLKILELDPEFIVEYIEWIYTPKREGSRWHHDNQDYSAIWKHHNHREIFLRVTELVYEKEKTAHWYTELRHFFVPSSEEKQLDTDILQRQEDLLAELIHTRYEDIDFIEFIFEVIVNFPKESRKRLLSIFTQNNKKLGDFQRLQLESGSMSWSGSAVPVYQERIDYLKSLLQIFSSSELLEHRVYIQLMIDSLENRKNLEKKEILWAMIYKFPNSPTSVANQKLYLLTDTISSDFSCRTIFET